MPVFGEMLDPSLNRFCASVSFCSALGASDRQVKPPEGPAGPAYESLTNRNRAMHLSMSPGVRARALDRNQHRLDESGLFAPVVHAHGAPFGSLALLHVAGSAASSTQRSRGSQSSFAHVQDEFADGPLPTVSHEQRGGLE